MGLMTNTANTLLLKVVSNSIHYNKETTQRFLFNGRESTSGPYGQSGRSMYSYAGTLRSF